MKSTAEKSSTTTSRSQEGSKPFFAKAGGGDFFAPSVQTKLKVGKPGDHHEREADSMAEKVVRGSEATPAVQNKCADCDAKEKMQRKPLADNITPFIQRMADKEEPVQKSAEKEEAVQKAEDKQEEPVQKMEDKKEEPVQKSTEKEEPVQKAEDKQEEPVQKMEDKKEEPVQKSTEKEEPVQKAEDKKEEPVQKAAEKEEPVQKAEDKEEATQTKSAAGATPTASPSVESGLNSSKGNGSPLPEGTRSTMESGFGVDFSGVRIHTDSQAAGMNRDLNAQAFTHGNDIYFNEGKYNPATTDGKTLLAHELTHTIQQGASVQRKEVLTPPPTQPLQMNEEEVDLAKELEAADQDQKKAIDPSIAEKAKEKVEQGKEAAEEKSAKKKAAKKKGAKGKGSGKRAAGKSSSRKRGKKGAAEAAEAALKKSLGTVGKDLSDASSFACAKADEKATDLAENEQTHDDAGEKQQQTDAAVVAPPEEGQAMSNNEQVAGLDAKPEPSTDKEAAKSTLNNALVSAMPTNIKEVNTFESEGKAKVVGSQVLGEVNKDVGAVKDTYNDIEQPLPAKPTPESTELPPEEAAPGTPMLDLGKGAVPPLKPEHTEVKEFDTKSDELLQKEGITQDQLDMVDSGELAEANKERKSLKKKVAEEPAKIQQFGEKASQKVEKDLKQEEAQGKAQMRAKRKRGLNETKANQTKTKSALEKKREEVTKHINGIFDQAKSSVTTKLTNLESQNLRAFDAGQLRASVEFEKEVKRDINAFKKRRYSGLFGGARWIKDYFAGIDDFPEVQNALSSGRERYIQKIDKLIADIDKANQKVIAECKLELANARKQIETYVKTLGPALRATGQKAMKEMKGKLAEMDKFIDQQRDKLREKLCSKREEAIKAIDKKIEKMKEEMSGLLSKLGNLILNAMIKFFEWALEKAGYSPEKIMSIINKGKAVIKKIVTDPIGFFKNIGKAVGQGVENFKNNIQQHLIKGMMSWLTGAMGDAGLQLPAQWDLKGVIFLLLQIMNLTKDALMKKLGEKIGQPMLQFAMTSVGIVKRVVAEGPMALWDMIKEKAEEIKEQVMEGIRDWVATEMVKQGVIKLLSMLNPVGAIVQAIIAIYNTVMFFVENWQRIVDFVSSVFNAIVDIAMGRLGPAIAAVERAMAQTIPIILGFIARLLNLSGIGKAIRKTIEKIRKPIDTIVDKMLNGVAKLVKPLVAKAKGLAQKGKNAIGSVLEKLGIKKRFKNQAGESHSIYFEGNEQNEQLFIASTPQTALEYLNDQEKLAQGDEVKLGIIKSAKSSNTEIGRLVRERAKQKDATKRGEIKKKIETEILRLASYFEQIGGADPMVMQNSKEELQGVTTQQNNLLSSNISMAKNILSPDEYKTASDSEKPWLAIMNYGKVVERLVARNANGTKFVHLGGPNQPDFQGFGKYKGLFFDVTTVGAIPQHLLRSYGKTLIFVTYSRPANFFIFPKAK